jgi:hypothetical protein
MDAIGILVVSKQTVVVVVVVVVVSGGVGNRNIIIGSVAQYRRLPFLQKMRRSNLAHSLKAPWMETLFGTEYVLAGSSSTIHEKKLIAACRLW